MRRASWLLAVGVLVLAGCDGDDPSAEAAATDAAAVEGSDAATEPNEAEASGEGPEEPESEVEPGDEQLAPPVAVTAPIGVVYEATGSLNETFGLIQTPEVSVFSNDDVIAYVEEETITVCPTGEGCLRSRREGLEAMGCSGGSSWRT